MSFVRPTCPASAWLWLAVPLVALGCGSSDESGAPGSGGGGAGGQAGAPAGPSALSFSQAETLMLAPGQSHELTVTATPPGQYALGFALLGDYEDAALDKSEATTDPSGVARVTVTAPGSSTAFSVRASAGNSVSAKLGVSVSASGFATLQVSPSYDGNRTVSFWVASVRTGTTCANLSGALTTDGDLKGTAPAGQIPQIGSVPVGPALAVTLRGGLSIAGCKDVVSVTAGQINAVEVSVSNLPMQLGDTDLELSLGVDPPQGDLTKVLALDVAVAAMAGGASDDAKALLDAMQDRTPDSSSAAAFQLARKSGNWDVSVASVLGDPHAIQKLASEWLAAGANGLVGSDTIRGKLRGLGVANESATIELTTVGGVDAASASLPLVTQAGWTAEPDDSVLLGTAFFFSPSRLSTALALSPAQLAAPGSADVPAALAALLSCKKVGATLANGGEAFSGCDATCVEALCEGALESMWQRARDASATPFSAATLEVAASGAAVVDDNARPMSFDGKWIGAFNAGTETVPVGGAASGQKPPPPR